MPQHNAAGGPELNGGIRLTPSMNAQATGATLAIGNEQLLPQSPAGTGITGEKSRNVFKERLTRWKHRPVTK